MRRRIDQFRQRREVIWPFILTRQEQRPWRFSTWCRAAFSTLPHGRGVESTSNPDGREAIKEVTRINVETTKRRSSLPHG